MDIKAVIFDLDGVLVDTDRYHYQAWKALADRLGICFNEEINEQLRGVSRMHSLEIILGDLSARYSIAQKEALCEEKNSAYRALIAGMTPKSVLDDTRRTLEELRRRKIPLAVGSSSKNAGDILAVTDLKKYFSAVADGFSIIRSKPDPEVFLKAAERLGVSPDAALVVEDAPSGIEAARAGGFLPVSIGYAARLALGAYTLERLSDVLSLPVFGQKF